MLEGKYVAIIELDYKAKGELANSMLFMGERDWGEYMTVAIERSIGSGCNEGESVRVVQLSTSFKIMGDNAQ